MLHEATRRLVDAYGRENIEMLVRKLLDVSEFFVRRLDVRELVINLFPPDNIVVVRGNCEVVVTTVRDVVIRFSYFKIREDSPVRSFVMRFGNVFEIDSATVLEYLSGRVVDQRVPDVLTFLLNFDLVTKLLNHVVMHVQERLNMLSEKLQKQKNNIDTLTTLLKTRGVEIDV